uniref:DUF4139 domain-containing protein n=1 Tax=Flavobacterium sp. TaxID=239 RepID=UPI00404B9B65
MKNLLVMLFWIGIPMTIFGQTPIITKSKIKAVTVYVNSAELTHETQVQLPMGISEIVVTNMANYVNENTIQVSAPATLSVMSVRFTHENFTPEKPQEIENPLFKKYNDSIKKMQRNLVLLSYQTQSIQKTIESLDDSENNISKKEKLEVSEQIKLLDFYKTRRLDLHKELFNFQNKEIALHDKINELNEKMQPKPVKTIAPKEPTGKLVLQVMNEKAGLVSLDLKYLTNNASWIPFYDLRATSVLTPMNLIYKARIQQNTGIDWTKAKLSLSNGNPNQNNQAPLLSSWFLRFGQIYQPVSNGMAMMNTIPTYRNNVTEEMDKKEKSLEDSSVNQYTTMQENMLHVSFDIDLAYDILSNGKPHSVTMKEIKMPAKFQYYAAPKLEKEAFLLAEISDYGQYNLLPGEANIIFEGMYIGKTYLNANQTQDTLQLSMGRDKKIAIKREKVVDKSGTKFLSSNKEQTFTYDITVRNNKKERIAMVLKDQIPLSTDEKIEIELLDKDGAKLNKETGVLTWQIKVEPNESKKFRISYRVKYPKDQVIPNL